MSKSQLIGLLIMCTAWGVTAANFSPSVVDVPSACNYALHFICIAMMLIGASRLYSGRSGGRVWVNIVIALTWAFDVFAISWAIVHPNPSAFGPHNFDDYAPVVMFTAGAVVWLVNWVHDPTRRSAQTSMKLSRKQHL